MKSPSIYRSFCVLVVFCCFCSTNASAHIGESAKEVVTRYGSGKSVDAQKPAQEADLYSFNGMHIVVQFWRGRSSRELYQKADGSPLSAAEINALLALNVEKSSWHQAGSDVWVRVDKLAVAFMGNQGKAMAVQSYPFHVEIQKNRKQADLPEEQKTLVNKTPPSFIIKIVVRYIDPSILPDSFAAKPKTFYLGGETYARVEEEPDPERHLHSLLICSEPDSWIINLDNRQGRHLVDPGPTFAMHTPIIMEPNAPRELASLEMGKEQEFFQQHQASPIEGQVIEGQRCNTSEFKQAGYRLLLSVRENTHQPMQLDVFRDDKPDFSVRYVSYQTDLPFDPVLFIPPSDVTIVEAKAGAN